MNLPPQELFTIEDVAVRWGESVSRVQDLTRRRLLPMGRSIISRSMKQGIKIKYYITRSDLETFERTTATAPVRGVSVKEYAAKHGISDKTVRRYIKEEKISARLTPGGRYKIFE